MFWSSTLSSIASVMFWASNSYEDHISNQRYAAGSPSGSYAPSVVRCPEVGVRVRQATEMIPLNPQERDYVIAKTKKSGPEWTKYLTHAKLQEFNLTEFVAGTERGQPGQSMPNIGIALSGGGERAMLFGSAILAAFDGNNDASCASGICGITQLATYVSGLNGGAAAVGTWAMAGFPSFSTMREKVWNLEKNIFFPGVMSSIHLIFDLYTAFKAKQTAGYQVSIVDLYAIALGRHLNVDAHGVGYGKLSLFSSIKETWSFKEHSVPFPIILALGREEEEVGVNLNSSIYEFSPFEFGTSSRDIPGGAYIPIEYLGTSMSNGIPTNKESCVVGFDNADYIIAASSDIAGAPIDNFLHNIKTNNRVADYIVEHLLGSLDDAKYVDARIPNPFQDMANSTDFRATTSEYLNLLDGGYAKENIPVYPLLNPARKVDVIIAVDSSNFGSIGESGRASYEKSLTPGFEGNPFPYFPPANQFIHEGLQNKTSIFGCYEVGLRAHLTPLVVYIPNYGSDSGVASISPLKDSHTMEEQLQIFKNGQAIASQKGNLAWGTCFACVVVDAQLKRNAGDHFKRTEQCADCFDQYCYQP